MGFYKRLFISSNFSYSMSPWNSNDISDVIMFDNQITKSVSFNYSAGCIFFLLTTQVLTASNGRETILSAENRK